MCHGAGSMNSILIVIRLGQLWTKMANRSAKNAAFRLSREGIVPTNHMVNGAGIFDSKRL
jgi:hypothetical protein